MIISKPNLSEEFENCYINEYPTFNQDRGILFVKNINGDYIDRDLNIALRWFKLGYYSKTH